MEKAKPSVFVGSNEEGKQMVNSSKGEYAFFCETTLIEYYTHRECELIQVGDKLDSKEYGIAMPRSE